MELKNKFKKCLKKLRTVENKDSLDFEYITENPISGDEKNPLDFGHDAIVTTLKDIVKKSPESFTIGLYGDWGSGKSTISLSLKDELIKEKIPLILFDVWKHEGDALRRTFLKEVHNFFKTDSLWKEGYKVKDDLFDNLTKSKKSSKLIKPGFLSYLKAVIFLPLFFSILLILFWIVFDKWLNILDFKKDDLPGSVLIFLGLFPLSFFTKIIFKYSETIKGDKVEFVEDKIQDPIEFEYLFKKILIGLNKEIKKVVFVFDNLDRVSGEKAIQIMSTIKTFLDPIDKTVKNRNIVFLIPCDESAIKRHLRKTLNYSKDFKGDNYHHYAGEYLRKFFNTIIWIPEFYTNELEDYATKKLEATKIKDFKNDELSALIVWVFDKNPRQIIQFINVLISNYVLLKNRPIEGFNLTKNVAQLGKYLLLIQKFPDIMEIYKSSLTYNLKPFPPELNEEVKGERRFSEKRVGRFVSFLNLTEHVKIDSLDLFFKLRSNRFEMELESGYKLIKLIETNKIKELIEVEKSEEKIKLYEEELNYLQNIDFKGKINPLSEIINEKLRRTNNPLLLSIFIDGVLHLTSYKNIKLNSKVYKMIFDKLNLNPNHASNINPKLIIEECYNKMNKSNDKRKLRDLIIKSHVQSFRNDNYKSA
jgi:hypothetical protein